MLDEAAGRGIHGEMENDSLLGATVAVTDGRPSSAVTSGLTGLQTLLVSTGQAAWSSG